MTPADNARRYPWTQYPKGRTCGAGLPSFSVNWIVPDDRANMYGWRSETRPFETREAALAAAAAPMGIAKSVEAVEWDWTKPHGTPGRITVLYQRKNPKHRR